MEAQSSSSSENAGTQGHNSENRRLPNDRQSDATMLRASRDFDASLHGGAHLHVPPVPVFQLPSNLHQGNISPSLTNYHGNAPAPPFMCPPMQYGNPATQMGFSNPLYGRPGQVTSSDPGAGSLPPALNFPDPGPPRAPRAERDLRTLIHPSLPQAAQRRELNPPSQELFFSPEASRTASANDFPLFPSFPPLPPPPSLSPHRFITHQPDGQTSGNPRPPYSSHPYPPSQRAPSLLSARAARRRANWDRLSEGRTMNARQAPSNEARPGHGYQLPRFGDMSESPPPPSPAGPNRSLNREIQLLQGATVTKMVASKDMLQSLERVRQSDLPGDERACNICYNDFGTANPEGLSEDPVRLPTCKHLFGERCIRTWLKDSDQCPYCRAKVPSQRRRILPSNSQYFLQYMRVHGMQIAEGNLEEYIDRMNALANTEVPEFINTQRLRPPIGLPPQSSVSEPLPRTSPMGHGEPPVSRATLRPSQPNHRRSPPEDAGSNERRTRQRRDDSRPATQALPEPNVAPASTAPELPRLRSRSSRVTRTTEEQARTSRAQLSTPQQQPRPVTGNHSQPQQGRPQSNNTQDGGNRADEMSIESMLTQIHGAYSSESDNDDLPWGLQR